MKVYAKVASDGWNLVTEDGRILCKFENLDRVKSYCRERQYDMEIYRPSEVARKKRPIHTCCIESCQEQSYGRGYCRKHYEEILLPKKRNCTHQHCKRKAYKAGLCVSHYNKRKKQRRLQQGIEQDYIE